MDANSKSETISQEVANNLVNRIACDISAPQKAILEDYFKAEEATLHLQLKVQRGKRAIRELNVMVIS